ncbi:IclR family transcriptional regulator [Actinomadura roseirufa]|uniref:IclR family transcriptional regulator n=1 Tax=Actinomadura roseirufa TaxID=2094049 RepID=UPI001A954A21|nr:helix-turn-helix domain-containing protein [Actinomadura roseirufa]
MAGEQRTGAGGRGVLEGAFAVLEELERGGEAGLTKVAAGAGLPKATTHRLLEQLVALDAVQRRDGRYRVGPRLFRVGQAWQPARTLRAAAWHPLRQFAAAAPGASVSLMVPDDAGTLVVGGIRGEADEVFDLRPGVVLPPGTAAGMVLAAGAADTAPPAGASAGEWARSVTEARRQGAAFVHETVVESVSCVAAPVRARSGQVVGAVGVVVLDGRRLTRLADTVKGVAALVSTRLARLPQGNR